MPKRNSSHACEISVASGTPVYTQDSISSEGELATTYSGIGYRWKKRGKWQHRAMLGTRTRLVHGVERRIYVNWREAGVVILSVRPNASVEPCGREPRSDNSPT